MSLNFAGSSSFSGSPISQTKTIDSRTLGYFDARYINTGERIPQSNLGCETTVTNNKTKIELHETTIGILLNKISVLETKVNSLERSRTSIEDAIFLVLRKASSITAIESSITTIESNITAIKSNITAIEAKISVLDRTRPVIDATFASLTREIERTNDLGRKVLRLEQFHPQVVRANPIPPETPEATVAKLTDLAHKRNK